MLRSYGMTAEEFNTISTNLNKDPILKQRIMLQAYYYKYEAANMLIMFSIITYYIYVCMYIE